MCASCGLVNRFSKCINNSIPVADLFQTKSQKVCRVSILVEFAIADPYVHIQRALLNPTGLTKLQEETKRIR